MSTLEIVLAAALTLVSGLAFVLRGALAANCTSWKKVKEDKFYEHDGGGRDLKSRMRNILIVCEEEFTVRIGYELSWIERILLGLPEGSVQTYGVAQSREHILGEYDGKHFVVISTWMGRPPTRFILFCSSSNVVCIRCDEGTDHKDPFVKYPSSPLHHLMDIIYRFV